jgi:hypothetical protein
VLTAIEDLRGDVVTAQPPPSPTGR